MTTLIVETAVGTGVGVGVGVGVGSASGSAGLAVGVSSLLGLSVLSHVSVALPPSL